MLKPMTQYKVDPKDSHVFVRDPNRRKTVCKHCKQLASAAVHQWPSAKVTDSAKRARLHRALDAVMDRVKK